MDDRTETAARAAIAFIEAQVAATPPTDFTQASACAGWTVADVLAHQVGQNRGMAQALAEGTVTREGLAAVPYTRAAWTTSVQTLLDVLDRDLPEGLVHQPELGSPPLPRSTVWAALTLDLAMHAWDIAPAEQRATLRPDQQLAQFVLEVARTVPDAAKGGERSPFASAVQVSDDSPLDAWVTALALCGRDAAR